MKKNKFKDVTQILGKKNFFYGQKLREQDYIKDDQRVL